MQLKRTAQMLRIVQKRQLGRKMQILHKLATCFLCKITDAPHTGARLETSWAAMQSGKYPELNLLYHVPNGGSRHKAEAGRLRAEGVKAGVPDLCLPVARGQYHGLYIELKRQRGGRTSDHQSEWLDALSAQGYKAALCYGWEQAAGTIIEYLTGGGTHD